MNVKKCVRALLCLYLTLIIATDAVKGQSLKVGDTLPPELWSLPLDVINHPEGKDCITLNDYKDKLIILDFWATWCGACIKKFPETGLLQDQFQNDLLFIGVASDSREKIENFIDRYQARNKERYVPLTILLTNQLQKYFSYKAIPHYVWIDKLGTIKAITHSADVNLENIHGFREGEDLKYSLKQDIKDFNSSAPLFIRGNGGEIPGQDFYRSILTGRVEGLNMSLTGLTALSDKSINKVSGINCDIPRLFTLAYPEASMYPASRVLLEVEKPEKLRFKRWKEDYLIWAKENTFTYEQNFPPLSIQKVTALIAQDFYRYWGLRGYFQEKEIACMIIKTNSDIHKSYSEGGPVENNLKTSGEDRVLQNYPLKTLVSYLNDNQDTYCFIDESNCKEKLDLQFPENIEHTADLTEALLRQGIELLRQKRKIRVFVITDKPSDHE